MPACMVNPESIRRAIATLERVHEGGTATSSATLALQSLYTAYAEAMLQSAGVHVDLVDVVRATAATNRCLSDVGLPVVTAVLASASDGPRGSGRSRTEPPPTLAPISSAT